MSGTILVVDDEQNIRKSLEIILSGEGFAVQAVGDGESALARLEKNEAHAMFLDVNLPGIDGMEVLRRVRARHPDLPVVMISGHATVERAVEATRLGAFDFVEKPFSRDRVLVLARNATESARLREENARLKDPETDILGQSEPMAALRQTISQVAVTNARVLILGESGTGKELVARALHRQSARAGAPFVRVNCAAIPEELIEAELFGAVKGAYTGATSARDGRFAAADGGTLLLDEVGDMTLKAQVKVLRVLQEGEFEPVGSTEVRRVDVRVLAATHQDLQRAVEEGRFREDLLFRLNVIPLHVPPLRERGDDLGQLVDHFLAHYATQHELKPATLAPTTRRLLEAHAWPGNVRELKNVVERMVILHHGQVVQPDHLPADLGRGAPAGDAASGEPQPYAHLPLRDAKEALERDMITQALDRHEGNVTRAAADLGLERTHLHKRIKALDLDR